MCAILLFFVLGLQPDPLSLSVEKTRHSNVTTWRFNDEAPRYEINEAGARACLDSLKGIQPPGTTFQLLSLRHSLSGCHLRFQILFVGIPIHGAHASVHLATDGRIVVHATDVNSVVEGLGPIFLPPTLFKVAQLGPVAQQELMTRMGAKRLRSEVTRRPVWFPSPEVGAIAAWQVSISTAEPSADHELIEAVEDGRELARINRMVYADGTGLVHLPNPVQTSGNTTLTDNNDASSPALEAERVEVTLQNLNDGTGLLIGSFVDLTLPGGLDVPAANEDDRNYLYTRDDPRFEQVVVYHTIDAIQRRIHDLGFDNDKGAANGIRDFPTRCNAHFSTEDVSSYSPLDDALRFGDGGVDDGEDGEIVAHEYGHALQFDQNPSWGGGEMDAMGEGFANYLAASFFAGDGNALFLEQAAALVADWDAVSYSESDFPHLARVDRDKPYPESLIGEVHADGEIWAAALWRIRAALGADVADRLILEHHFALPAAATMTQAAEALLDADAGLHGGANQSVLRDILCERGLLGDNNCNTNLSPPELITPGAGELIFPGLATEISWSTTGQPAAAVYEVFFSPQCSSSTLLEDGFENDIVWTASHQSGALDWALTPALPNGGAAAFFAGAPASVTDQLLTRDETVTVPEHGLLRFFSDYDLEFGGDGGVVELSTDGTNWMDLGSRMISGGYNGTVAAGTDNPLAGRAAFTGTSGRYLATEIDLSDFVGQGVFLRFRLGTDNTIDSGGWFIDDIALLSQAADVLIGSSQPGADRLSWLPPTLGGSEVCLRIRVAADGGPPSELGTGPPFEVSSCLLDDAFRQSLLEWPVVTMLDLVAAYNELCAD